MSSVEEHLQDKTGREKGSRSWFSPAPGQDPEDALETSWARLESARIRDVGGLLLLRSAAEMGCRTAFGESEPMLIVQRKSWLRNLTARVYSILTVVRLTDR